MLDRMTPKQMQLTFYVVACSVAALISVTCSQKSAPQPILNANSNAAAVNLNAQPSVSPAAFPANHNAMAASSSASAGEAIDTSKFDAEIERLKKPALRKDAPKSATIALAKAYADRGNAFTQARQYRVALGDYRRALKYDPNNEDAQQGATMIVTILRGMGRDVPAEGAEPTPLPYKNK